MHSKRAHRQGQVNFLNISGLFTPKSNLSSNAAYLQSTFMDNDSDVAIAAFQLKALMVERAAR